MCVSKEDVFLFSEYMIMYILTDICASLDPISLFTQPLWNLMLDCRQHLSYSLALLYIFPILKKIIDYFHKILRGRNYTIPFYLEVPREI